MEKRKSRQIGAKQKGARLGGGISANLTANLQLSQSSFFQSSASTTSWLGRSWSHLHFHGGSGWFCRFGRCSHRVLGGDCRFSFFHFAPLVGDLTCRVRRGASRRLEQAVETRQVLESNHHRTHHVVVLVIENMAVPYVTRSCCRVKRERVLSGFQVGVVHRLWRESDQQSSDHPRRGKDNVLPSVLARKLAVGGRLCAGA